MNEKLYRLRGIANYQFNAPIGHLLFPDKCTVEVSKSSGRIRRVKLNSIILATIRAHDGMIVLTIAGGQRLHQSLPYPKRRVMIQKDVGHFIAKGRSVFAKHVSLVDSDLRAGDEVLVVDNKDTLLAVGKANLSPQEMLDLTRGVAVKVRHAIKKRKT
ncbi:MAG: PUA domain-containing protein [Promethearchaeota archaeon]